MASYLDIAPALGRGLNFAQNLPGGYDAIDLRRAFGLIDQEGVVENGAYKVSQRGAGANMSVDVATTAGGYKVQGDDVSNQGVYYIPPIAATANLDITTAHATLPRIDQVVLEAIDDEHTGGGITRARVYVLDGTATSGATLENRNGAASLPASTARLADILVPATDTTISDSQIRDRRIGTSFVLATAETHTTGASYGKLPTADQISVVVPDGRALLVQYSALWKNSVDNAGRAAIFIGTDQLKIAQNDAVPLAYDTDGPGGAAGLGYAWITSWHDGLYGGSGGGASDASTVSTPLAPNLQGAPTLIELPSGTYDVSIQFKATSGTVTVKERKLRAWVV